MRVSLFHDLKMPMAAPASLVLRSSLAKIIKQIAAATLGIDGHLMREISGGVYFNAAPADPGDSQSPFAVSAVPGGFTIAPGYVRVLWDGSTFTTPVIGSTSLDNDPPPVLYAQWNGVIAIELQIQFNRGFSPGLPFDLDLEFVALPEVKWLRTITTSLGVIDGTDVSTGVFAVPVALVSNGILQQLRLDHLYPQGFVTSIIA